MTARSFLLLVVITTRGEVGMSMATSCPGDIVDGCGAQAHQTCLGGSLAWDGPADGQVILGLYWSYIGIRQNEMEATT